MKLYDFAPRYLQYHLLQIDMIRSVCALQLEIQEPLIGYLE